MLSAWSGSMYDLTTDGLAAAPPGLTDLVGEDGGSFEVTSSGVALIWVGGGGGSMVLGFSSRTWKLKI